MAVGNYKLFRLLNLVFTLQTVQTLMRCSLETIFFMEKEGKYKKIGITVFKIFTWIGML